MDRHLIEYIIITETFADNGYTTSDIYQYIKNRPDDSVSVQNHIREEKVGTIYWKDYSTIYLSFMRISFSSIDEAVKFKLTFPEIKLMFDDEFDKYYNSLKIKIFYEIDKMYRASGAYDEWEQYENKRSTKKI